MRNASEKIIKYIDSLNCFLGSKISWLCLLIVCFMFINVVQRYAFSSNAIWQQELVQYLHAIIFLSVSGYTLRNNRHVRVDVFYEKMGTNKRKIVDIIGAVTLLIPVNMAILYFSFGFISNSFSIYEGSRESGGMQGVFILKMFIAIYAITVALQGVSLVLKNIISYRDIGNS